MPRRAKLSAESTRDTDWQRDEYAKLMGEQKTHEQQVAYRRENGLCTCRGFKGETIKTRGSFRTLHHRDCSKWKPWMEEVREEHERYRRAT
jgi:hypothetical protein